MWKEKVGGEFQVLGRDCQGVGGALVEVWYAGGKPGLSKRALKGLLVIGQSMDKLYVGVLPRLEMGPKADPNSNAIYIGFFLTTTAVVH